MEFFGTLRHKQDGIVDFVKRMRLDTYDGFHWHLTRGEREWSCTSYRHPIRELKEAVYLSTRYHQEVYAVTLRPI
ncbi:hypothetical protein TNCV_1413011 [Trichonephila clavipes]|nr:hypothetical protein TNCV_1413011 [Trichonephila clavipes]